MSGRGAGDLIRIQFESCCAESIDEFRNGLPDVIVERDVQNALSIRWRFEVAFFQNGHVWTSERSDQHTHFENDILACTWLGFVGPVLARISNVVWRHEHDSEAHSIRRRAHFVFQGFNDREPTAACVCQDERIEAEFVEDQLQLLACSRVVPVDNEDAFRRTGAIAHHQRAGSSRRGIGVGGFEGAIDRLAQTLTGLLGFALKLERTSSVVPVEDGAIVATELLPIRKIRPLAGTTGVGEQLLKLFKCPAETGHERFTFRKN
jgi:hypothetical protein